MRHEACGVRKKRAGGSRRAACAVRGKSVIECLL